MRRKLGPGVPAFGFVAQRTDFARGYLVIVAAAAAMALTAAGLVRQGARVAGASGPRLAAARPTLADE